LENGVGQSHGSHASELKDQILFHRDKIQKKGKSNEKLKDPKEQTKKVKNDQIPKNHNATSCRIGKIKGASQRERRGRGEVVWKRRVHCFKQGLENGGCSLTPQHSTSNSRRKQNRRRERLKTWEGWISVRIESPVNTKKCKLSNEAQDGASEKLFSSIQGSRQRGMGGSMGE